RWRSRAFTRCFRQREPSSATSPHSVQRPSRFMRSWYLRCREIGNSVNSSFMRALILSPVVKTVAGYDPIHAPVSERFLLLLILSYKVANVKRHCVQSLLSVFLTLQTRKP